MSGHLAGRRRLRRPGRNLQATGKARHSPEDIHAALDVVSQGSHIRHGQDSRPIELALDGQVKVLGSHGLVLVVVARHVKRHEVAELEVGKRPGSLRVGKREVLSLGHSVGASDVRTRELRRLG